MSEYTFYTTLLACSACLSFRLSYQTYLFYLQRTYKSFLRLIFESVFEIVSTISARGIVGRIPDVALQSYFFI